MHGPLHGIKILDLSQVILGPWATQTLADMGADVIKIEPPAGDITRRIGLQRNPGMASFFLGVNRNKRSVALDLKAPSGRELMLRLARSADVVVHAMRPRAVARLGLSYEAVSRENPSIIYVACHGFRSAGPYADRPAYDDLIQNLAGFSHLQQMTTGTARYLPSIVCDKTLSLTVVANVAMALLHRFRSGEGQRIETPMFETMVSFVMVEHLYGRIFDPPLGPAGYSRVLAPSRRPYRTRDGIIGVLPYNDAHWQRFTRLPGFEVLAADERYASVESRHLHVEALYADIGAIVADWTTDALATEFERADIPHTRMNTLDDLLSDPHLDALGMWKLVEHETEGRLRIFDIPSDFSRTPGSIRRLPPRLGEHSEEVLKEFGLDDGEIRGLIDAGIVVQASPTSVPIPATEGME